MGFPFVYCVVCGCPFDIPPFEEINDDRWANDDPFSDETKQVCRAKKITTNSNPITVTTLPEYSTRLGEASVLPHPLYSRKMPAMVSIRLSYLIINPFTGT